MSVVRGGPEVAAPCVTDARLVCSSWTHRSPPTLRRKSATPIRSIRSGSTSQVCRRAGRPPPSWQRRTPICTRPSGSIPASPAGRQAIFPPRSSPCGREAGLKIADGGTPLPTIVFHGDRDTTVHPSNRGRILEQPAKATSPATKVLRGRVPHGHAYTRTILTDAGGRAISEHWNIHGAGHAWSGGQSRRLQHRSARAGRDTGNAAFLPHALGASGTAAAQQQSASASR
jgi:hypothetical protein